MISNKEKTTSKTTIKTILFAGLIMTLMVPLSAIDHNVFAESSAEQTVKEIVKLAKKLQIVEHKIDQAREKIDELKDEPPHSVQSEQAVQKFFELKEEQKQITQTIEDMSKSTVDPSTIDPPAGEKPDVGSVDEGTFDEDLAMSRVSLLGDIHQDTQFENGDLIHTLQESDDVAQVVQKIGAKQHEISILLDEYGEIQKENKKLYNLDPQLFDKYNQAKDSFVEDIQENFWKDKTPEEAQEA